LPARRRSLIGGPPRKRGAKLRPRPRRRGAEGRAIPAEQSDRGDALDRRDAYCSPQVSPSHGENRGSSPLGSASNSNDLAPMGCLFELLWGVFGSKRCGTLANASERRSEHQGRCLSPLPICPNAISQAMPHSHRTVFDFGLKPHAQWGAARPPTKITSRVRSRNVKHRSCRPVCHRAAEADTISPLSSGT